MQPWTSAKSQIRRRFGLWPVMEWRNRVLSIRGTIRNRRREKAELTRLRQQIPKPLYAKVLVVIPTYRRPVLLGEAVSTVLAQTVKDILIVVVDDGGGLPDMEPNDRVLAVSLRENTGTAGLVRNVGIQLADSEYIAFLDDDNRWKPDHLATALELLDSNPELVGVYTSVERLRPDGTVYDTLDEPFDRERLKEVAYIDTSCLVVRRSLHPRFSVLPRSRGTLPFEDWDFVWRMSKRGSIEHSPHFTVEYSVNQGSYYTDWDGPDAPW